MITHPKFKHPTNFNPLSFSPHRLEENICKQCPATAKLSREAVGRSLKAERTLRCSPGIWCRFRRRRAASGCSMGLPPVMTMPVLPCMSYHVCPQNLKHCSHASLERRFKIARFTRPIDPTPAPGVIYPHVTSGVLDLISR